MENIHVKNLTGQDQNFGSICVTKSGADIPLSLARTLVEQADYCSDDKGLLSEYPVVKDDLLHIGWSSPFYYCDGYGSIGQEIASVLLSVPGVRCRIVPRDYDPSDPRLGGLSLDRWSEVMHVPESIVNALRSEQPKCLYGINMTWPRDCHKSAFPRTIGYTMFETNATPLPWTKSMNQARRLITPCPANMEAFRNRGVTVPIDVVPQGINPEAWPIIDRAKRDQPYTFLIAGGLTYRKNPIGAVQAFRAAFPENNDVRLLIKTRAGRIAGGFRNWINTVPRDDRIEIIAEDSTPEAMAMFMATADCFLWPSRGEGFGLPPLQAMATGLPVIVSNNSGMSQYCDKKYNYPIPCKEVPVPRQSDGGYPDDWGDCGNWWEPDFDCLVEAMRNIVRHPNRAYNIGMRSAEWVRENWTVMHTCQKILEVVRTDAEEDGIEW